MGLLKKLIKTSGRIYHFRGAGCGICSALTDSFIEKHRRRLYRCSEAAEAEYVIITGGINSKSKKLLKKVLRNTSVNCRIIAAGTCAAGGVPYAASIFECQAAAGGCRINGKAGGCPFREEELAGHLLSEREGSDK